MTRKFEKFMKDLICSILLINILWIFYEKLWHGHYVVDLENTIVLLELRENCINLLNALWNNIFSTFNFSKKISQKFSTSICTKIIKNSFFVRVHPVKVRYLPCWILFLSFAWSTMLIFNMDLSKNLICWFVKNSQK